MNGELRTFEEIKGRLEKVEKEAQELKKLLLSRGGKTKTGKITPLSYGENYFLIGQRGQVYSRKMKAGNVEQFRYLNNMRRLFLTEAEAILQVKKDLLLEKFMENIDAQL